MGIFDRLFPKKSAKAETKICIHEWQVVEDAENSGNEFPEYAVRTIRDQLREDFKGLLDVENIVYPEPAEIRTKKIVDEYESIFGDFRLKPQVFVCLKCMRYTSEIDKVVDRVKEIYSDYYRRNLSLFINKSKTIKLTLTGVTEIREGANQLENLNIIMKEFKQLHEKENQLLEKLKLV